MKRCSRCKEDKPRAAFASNRAARDGLQAYCRECWSTYHQARQLAKGKNVRPKVKTPPGHKYCRACGEIKPHAQWDRNRTASDGLSTRCKACRAIEGRQGHLKRSYGITEAQRDEMIAGQKGLCVICLKAPAVHVDHCHETGRVRGVLCFNCNSAIGKLGDDPDAVRRAASYLEGISWKPTLVAPGVYQLPS
ncbi:endonuclease VII domain-containing protein [Streptomyces acidiscabies]|uniref:Endonuclease VII domain-containing protein n=1 Tax=Streptomyces acidiscabies TaxID=42234 RepID=A0AAP6EEZ8_9ACTN|nr:endonuclease VII domain-containing protein [Streptomyces acidiscabies]MBZ3911928.1 endonuclease VII domain-containing protein [Streptomyces acidiscabies]MDX2959735.1 endonuclease VII domain-containing protein [Streptomyces acidiscabies]MDX3022247.1 endonuclease VII domain-containing protein [Streptomyces acidiscabies]MDX3792587.1 endonuclease VII domain-containing protein [Streptomyces acidiscabies]GAV43170.1 recombination endonuclease VII [Streptomyces acidiscabies]